MIVHRTDKPLDRIGQRCKDCGFVLLSPFQVSLLTVDGSFFDDNADVAWDNIKNAWILYDFLTHSDATRCIQDLRPLETSELHSSFEEETDFQKTRELLNGLVDKLIADKNTDLSGHYRFELQISVAKFKKDSLEESGWRRVW